eukprot:TRINITY_DN8607_c0_g1_i1.p1 TRINITY_DN8607_c0_g1~~TRINITY_DN8607_c0_g1_i1.p1  ORF type:complete len:176 (-),score=10.91 TRINITY_DN8607_c0_g1_i1:111-638(-)
MATLTVSNKRSFDQCYHNTTPAACSPHKIAFLDVTELTNGPSKRPSSFLDTSGPVKRLRQISDTSVKDTSTPVLPIRESAFAGVSVDTDFPEVNSNSRKVKLCRQCQTNPAERVFSSDEVRAIVAKALKRSETELRFEYDRVLQERLSEQFHNFSKYYEDSVSRLSKQSDFSYMS